MPAKPPPLHGSPKSPTLPVVKEEEEEFDLTTKPPADMPPLEVPFVELKKTGKIKSVPFIDKGEISERDWEDVDEAHSVWKHYNQEYFADPATSRFDKILMLKQWDEKYKGTVWPQQLREQTDAGILEQKLEDEKSLFGKKQRLPNPMGDYTNIEDFQREDLNTWLRKWTNSFEMLATTNVRKQVAGYGRRVDSEFRALLEEAANLVLSKRGQQKKRPGRHESRATPRKRGRRGPPEVKPNVPGDGSGGT